MQTIQDVLYTPSANDSIDPETTFHFEPFVPEHDRVEIKFEYFDNGYLLSTPQQQSDVYEPTKQIYIDLTRQRSTVQPHAGVRQTFLELTTHAKGLFKYFESGQLFSRKRLDGHGFAKEIYIDLSHHEPSTMQYHGGVRQALLGILVHELAHAFQHHEPESYERLRWWPRGFIQPPQGLIEGIAVYVELRSGASSHWDKRPRSSSELTQWDAGYGETAMFLQWLEMRFEKGVVGLMNDRILKVGYVRGGRDEFWTSLFGVTIEQLWLEYCDFVDAYNWVNVLWRWKLPFMARRLDLEWLRRSLRKFYFASRLSYMDNFTVLDKLFRVFF